MCQIETAMTILSHSICMRGLLVSMKTYRAQNKNKTKNKKSENHLNIETRVCLPQWILKLHCLHFKGVEALFCFQKTGKSMTMPSFVRSRLFQPDF